ncbi:hypothetical protein VTK73DRAFT_9656 [Phialemonium thermophilum]|uniref:PIPK domain-containing protein n=1 Tax=Phialemonium thermophilum TaxID=223376 RepID=A0ABR3XJL2_9PEZI
MSLTGKYILSELGSPGKSGSFFYFSRDYKYIIKTIHHGEHKFLRKMLKDYYQHVVENPNTLLSQFYGLHRVKMPYGKKIHFVIMNNLFPPHRDIHQTFDLKGSTFGRDFKEEDLEKNPRATLKDLNWLRRHKHLELGIEKKRLFLEQLRKDVKLLQRLEIMDYSLLIGIHDVQRGNEENLRDKTLQVFNPGGNNTEEFDPSSVLMRTPSKLENMRKARELRQMIKAERPVPLGQSSSRMPDELENNQSKQGFIFYQDDGGFRATHEDNTPADEIYYLGVIDCLTHYGIVKKIEHFWKGLSHDRSQISALPPDQYGDRFINFISGVTMSAEEAARLEQEKNRAAAEAARTTKSAGRKASTGDGRTSEMGQTSSGDANAGVRALEANQISSSQSQQSSMVPALDMSPKADETLQRAEEQARKTEKRGAQEDSIPERVLRTSAVTLGAVGAPSVSKHGQGSSPDRRESSTASPPAILPVLEEATEANSTATQSQTSHSSNTATEEDNRPLTPAKDGKEKDSGFSDVLLGAHGRLNGNRGPPTPPKTGYGRTVHAKPGSADSGYGVASGTVSANSTVAPMHHKPLNLRPQVSRDSLDKALPPLPKSGMQSQGLS